MKRLAESEHRINYSLISRSSYQLLKTDIDLQYAAEDLLKGNRNPYRVKSRIDLLPKMKSPTKGAAKLLFHHAYENSPELFS